MLGKDFTVYGTIENPLFLAKDVAEWIDYDGSKVGQMLTSVDEEEKLTTTLYRSGQNREMWLVTEDGLYEILMQSRKPIAKQFKKEVKAILKQIRLTGGSVAKDREAEFIEVYFPNFTQETKLAMVLDLQGQNTMYRQLIEEQKPLVDFANQVSDTKDLISMGHMAKLLHDENITIGRNRLFDWLKAKNILMNDNIPYQRFVDGGYFKVREGTKETKYGEKVFATTYITGKGQIYIMKKLQNEFTTV